MKQQLVLDRLAVSLGETKYYIRYRKDYIDPNDPRIDGSHIHDCYEIYFNVSGDVSFFVNNKLYPIKKGDVIFARGGEVHFCVYNRPILHEYFCVWINSDRNSAVTEFIERNLKKNFISCGDLGEDISNLLFKMNNVPSSDDRFEDTVNLLRLLILISERREKQTPPPPSILPIELQRIVDDISENFAEISGVNDILKRHYISQATLNRRFRKYMQISPRAFLEDKKLAYARQLLLCGVSVTDACFNAGFSDCSRFITVFKRKFGETPHKYKSK